MFQRVYVVGGGKSVYWDCETPIVAERLRRLATRIGFFASVVEMPGTIGDDWRCGFTRF